MPDICLYCQVHQPYRLRRFRLFDIGNGGEYFDDTQNRAILRRVADKCYIPTNRLLTDLIRQSDGAFKVALSLSGAVLEQMAEYAPDALESFQELVDTGGVELLGETYYHSLAALGDLTEFETQVGLHREAIYRFFRRRPEVFRNTELVFSDDLAPVISRLGYRGVLVEGAGHILGWRTANYVYESSAVPGLRLLARNYPLSDDVGFRFSDRNWSGWPVTADKYARWVADSPGDSLHVFLDYETFGEHQWSDTGIFEFLRHLPEECRQQGVGFVHPSTLVRRQAVAPLSFPRPTSWADEDRDVTAWLGNRLQKAAHERLYAMRSVALGAGSERLEEWRRLSTSDHLYYMCTKYFNDGDVHKYFSPYDTPYDAFITFMNVLQDWEQRVRPADIPVAVPAGVAGEFAEMACVA